MVCRRRKSERGDRILAWSDVDLPLRARSSLGSVDSLLSSIVRLGHRYSKWDANAYYSRHGARRRGQVWINEYELKQRR